MTFGIQSVSSAFSRVVPRSSGSQEDSTPIKPTALPAALPVFAWALPARVLQSMDDVLMPALPAALPFPICTCPSVMATPATTILSHALRPQKGSIGSTSKEKLKSLGQMSPATLQQFYPVGTQIYHFGSKRSIAAWLSSEEDRCTLDNGRTISFNSAQPDLESASEFLVWQRFSYRGYYFLSKKGSPLKVGDRIHFLSGKEVIMARMGDNTARRIIPLCPEGRRILEAVTPIEISGKLVYELSLNRR